MLSAAGEDTDRIVGLELGADDYLPKPANPRELLARIRALMRRSAATPEPAASPYVGYEFSGWTLSIWARELQTPDGVVVPLTGSEFALLRTFVEHPREVLDRDLDAAGLRAHRAHGRAVADEVEQCLDIVELRLAQEESLSLDLHRPTAS